MKPAFEISVVIPAYNAAEKIADAIHSIHAQTLQPFELIVVDDGSKDRTAEVVRELGRQYRSLRLISQPNGGVSKARNTGIGEAKGNWVAFLDADDLWLPGRLEQQVALLENHPDLVWVAGSFLSKRAGSKLLKDAPGSRISADIRDRGAEVVNVLDHMAGKTSFWTGTMLIRKTVLAEAGLFDVALRVAEDSDLWTRIAMRNPEIGFVASPVAVYTTNSADSLTATAVQRMESSQFVYYQKIQSYIGKCNDEKQRSQLAKLLSYKIACYAKCLIRAGNGRVARMFILKLKESGLPVPNLKIRLASLVPHPVIRMARFLKQLVSGVSGTFSIDE